MRATGPARSFMGQFSLIHGCLMPQIYQQGKTPGRRGEQIKQEEIDKEIVRRKRIQQQKNEK